MSIVLKFVPLLGGQLSSVGVHVQGRFGKRGMGVYTPPKDNATRDGDHDLARSWPLRAMPQAGFKAPWARPGRPRITRLGGD